MPDRPPAPAHASPPPAGSVAGSPPTTKRWRIGLIGQALIPLSIGTALVVALATLIAYQAGIRHERAQALDAILHHAEERSGREQANFSRVERQVRQARALLAARLAAPNGEAPPPLAESGTRRLLPATGAAPLAVFVAAAAAQDRDQLRAVATARALLADLGPALADYPAHLSIAVADRWLVGWGDDEVDLVASMLPGDPVLMPAERRLLSAVGEVRWSGVFIEPAAGRWLVAATAALDIPGVGRAAVTQVLPIDEILARSSAAQLPGSETLAYDAAGQLLAHSRLDARIRAANGTLTLAGSGDPLLARLAAAIPPAGPAAELISDPQGGGWFAVSRLTGPAWTMVTVHPAAAVERRARTTVAWILLVGAAVIVAQSLVLVAVLRLRVGAPLRRLSAAATALAESRPGPALDAKRGDEVGNLSRAFQGMGEAVAAREAALRGALATVREHEERLSARGVELEDRVAARTAALSESVALLAGAKRALELANRELEAFSYSVAHDLRSPLRSIDGFSKALLEDCAERLDDTGRGHLATIRRATARMGRLIDDLLGLSRIARRAMAVEEVDLGAIAGEVLEALREKEPQRSVDCRIAAGLRCRADPGLARIVLENLLGNAWKYTGRRADARIELAAEGDAFVVRDNGAGFDQAHAGALFAPFQRLHAAHEFEGTGIGLATVKRIIDRHGGWIRASGEVGVGAAVRFAFSGGASAPAAETPA